MSDETRKLVCAFCHMSETRAVTLPGELRVTLVADSQLTMYAQVLLPACDKHENIPAIVIRTRP